MNAAAVIHSATAAGLNLKLSNSGNIAVAGDDAVIRRWVAAIREHKPEILILLKEPNSETSKKPDISEVLQSPEATAAMDQSCLDCFHFTRPGLSAGYCKGRDDLPLAYGLNHPLRTLPEDGGAACGSFKSWRD